ncbi:hypothetical protein [Candidatus Galacturonibacter soehngenii]|uniref:Uncharacterized protein n=1 Tax=Candidatus Galacturonatibacter soehngenii TaxID=2307010 RepID=A0A7V7QHB0_9FIRM|nr:hypothetical protein [Candidatus Galacturonibacter soehngenii]KAB1434311.1 hypothetical protein F7O84_17635 [Candidatus Galacturonibacter soehngenii]
MIEIILVLICMIGLGLAIEKIIHMDYDVEGVTLALKQDVKKFVSAVFREPQIRHTFDITLANDIKMVTKPYAKAGFEIQLGNNLFRNVPAVGIRFVPDHVLEEAELQELIRLLLIKFKEYIGYYGLNWRVFATYSVGSDYANVYIYYAEWECDLHPFANVYRQTVRHKIDKSGGILRDEELEAELKHVNKTGI